MALDALSKSGQLTANVTAWLCFSIAVYLAMSVVEVPAYLALQSPPPGQQDLHQS